MSKRLVDQKDQEIERLERTISQNTWDLKAQRDSIAQKDQQLLGQDNAITEKDQEIAKCKEDLSRALRDHENSIQAIKETVNYDKAVLQSKHQHTLETLQDKHRNISKGLRQELENTRLAAEDAMKQKTVEHQELIQNLEQRQADAISKLEEKNQKKLNQLAVEHAHQTERLHSDKQDLNTALLKRDLEKYQGAMFQTHNLPRKADNQIRDHFAEIQQLVEDLGRLTWRKDQKAWTERLLQKAGHQHVARELKRAILQDAAWTVLFNRVFISPFRIFGAAGLQLEQQWSLHYGKGIRTLTT
jgi:hypothetical protein